MALPFPVPQGRNSHCARSTAGTTQLPITSRICLAEIFCGWSPQRLSILAMVNTSCTKSHDSRGTKLECVWQSAADNGDRLYLLTHFQRSSCANQRSVPAAKNCSPARCELAARTVNEGRAAPGRGLILAMLFRLQDKRTSGMGRGEDPDQVPVRGVGMSHRKHSQTMPVFCIWI